MNVKMMAIKLTSRTYPIAVACVNPGDLEFRRFQDEPDSYLIINKLAPMYVGNEEGGQRFLALQNFVLSGERFQDEYIYASDNVDPDGFNEINDRTFDEIARLRQARIRPMRKIYDPSGHVSYNYKPRRVDSDDTDVMIKEFVERLTSSIIKALSSKDNPE